MSILFARAFRPLSEDQQNLLIDRAIGLLFIKFPTVEFPSSNHENLRATFRAGFFLLLFDIRKQQ